MSERRSREHLQNIRAGLGFLPPLVFIYLGVKWASEGDATSGSLFIAFGVFLVLGRVLFPFGHAKPSVRGRIPRVYALSFIPFVGVWVILVSAIVGGPLIVQIIGFASGALCLAAIPLGKLRARQSARGSRDER